MPVYLGVHERNKKDLPVQEGKGILYPHRKKSGELKWIGPGGYLFSRVSAERAARRIDKLIRENTQQP